MIGAATGVGATVPAAGAVDGAELDGTDGVVVDMFVYVFF